MAGMVSNLLLCRTRFHRHQNSVRINVIGMIQCVHLAAVNGPAFRRQVANADPPYGFKWETARGGHAPGEPRVRTTHSSRAWPVSEFIAAATSSPCFCK